MNILTELFGHDHYSFTVFGLTIRYYALCLLGGGIIALLLSNYRAHKKGYPMDIYDTIFLWAFPSGVVGARIWYVIATWNEAGSTFKTDFWSIFRTWEGGLAIQGGVIGGAIAGILVALIRRKGWDVFEACDYAVPTILIAQTIGRWGNFINQEVYGQIVDPSAWGFLPSGILGRMVIGGSFRVPLFFLEGLINLGGYFVLSRFVPLIFQKRYRKGDQLFVYFTWYGIVRALLEPLRDAQYNMGNGTGKMEAVIMSWVFIGIGILGVVLNHVIRDVREKKQAESLSVHGQ
jgi:phosphatidylglycerol:prolipoprotein diacylglycerol transferase